MKIALISDTHLAPAATAFRCNAEAALAWIAATEADLVVHLGDITADGAKDERHFAEAAEVFAPLEGRIRFLPGNHDIGDNPMEGGGKDEPTVDAGRLAAYRRVFGRDWWSLEAGRWALIGLNAQLLGAGEAEEARQFDWLAERLAGARGPVGLFLHKPLFRDSPADEVVHHRYPPLAPRRRLFDMLAGCDLRFVVCGHTHQTRRFHVGEVEHVWAPSTAFVIPDRLQERIGDKVVGTMLLDLTDDGHQIDLVVPSGLAQLDLADHAAVYPQLSRLLA